MRWNKYRRFLEGEKEKKVAFFCRKKLRPEKGYMNYEETLDKHIIQVAPKKLLLSQVMSALSSSIHTSHFHITLSCQLISYIFYHFCQKNKLISYNLLVYNWSNVIFKWFTTCTQLIMHQSKINTIVGH